MPRVVHSRHCRCLEDQEAQLYRDQDSSPGSKNEKKQDPQQRRALEVIADALAYIQSTARTEDYFSGYTFVEAVEERVAEIGEDVEDVVEVEGKLAIRVNPDDRATRRRASVRVRNLTGLSKLEELAVLKSRVTQAVDYLLTAEKADEMEEKP